MASIRSEQAALGSSSAERRVAAPSGRRKCSLGLPWKRGAPGRAARSGRAGLRRLPRCTMSRRGEGGGPKRHRSRSESSSLPGGSPAGSSSRGHERKEQKRTKREVQHIQQIQHLESFYEKLPPGFIKEDETKPEDCIPDVPGNENAREFLAHAPTKGLWMPLGKEVKVMQCWRCKRYGHRTGDKECPFFIKGNQKLEQFRVAHEDPMYDIIRENKRHEKEMRIQQLKQLLEDSTSDEEGSSSSSSSSSSGYKGKHKRKRKRKEKKKKKRKHKSSKPSKRSKVH